MTTMIKKTIVLTLIAFGYNSIFAQQDAENYVKEAQDYIKAKNFKEARLAIQQTIAAINAVVGEEILNVLPTEINGFKSLNNDYDDYITLYDGRNDGGMYVTRTYRKSKENYDNSFTLAVYVTTVGTNDIKNILNDPAQLNSKTDRIVKVVNGRKGLVRSYSEGEASNYKSATLDIPYNDFYVNIYGYGEFSKDDALIKIASKIDFEKLRKITGDE